MVSIIIPARNEKFLQKTIDGIFENATGKIEIIAGIDGGSISPELKNDKRVLIVHMPESIGMRPMINEMAKVAQGDYIMKSDAHNIFDKGFDEKLSADCEKNWVVVPRQYSLNDDAWARNMSKSSVDYWYLSSPQGRDIKGRVIGLHAVRWFGKLSDKTIDDLMSFQGSCWFTTRKHFDDMGFMDAENYGHFAYEACEIGMKTWMSGGRVIVNKNTWFAHLHKGKKHGRGYALSSYSVIKSGNYNCDLWMNNKWARSICTMRQFVEKFSPVPTWDNYDWSQHVC